LDRAYVREPGKVPFISIANSNLAIHQGKDFLDLPDVIQQCEPGETGRRGVASARMN
jgi:hypothetical protein